jgi:hypothetical protein
MEHLVLLCRTRCLEQDLKVIYAGLDRLFEERVWDFAHQQPQQGVFANFARAYLQQVFDPLRPYYVGLNRDFYFWLIREAKRP